MPTISRLFIRAGMIYFVVALALAVLAEVSRFAVFPLSQALVMPVFWHFLLVGWITQIIMGVSVWMFPRKQRGVRGGGEKQAWIAFVCLNIGLLLRAATEPLSAVTAATSWIQWGMTGSAVLQVAGGAAYVAGIWPRIKGSRKRTRDGG